MIPSYDLVFVIASYSDHSQTHRLAFPLGPLYLVALAEAEGLSVKVIDYNGCEQSPVVSSEDFADNQAPVYAIYSLLTGYGFVKETIQAIRQANPSAVILLGGAITHGLPEFMLRATGADALVEGEAESVFMPLVEAAQGGRLDQDIPGVYRRRGDRVIRPRQRQALVQNLDLLPFPAWSAIDINLYIQNTHRSWLNSGMRSGQVLTSRGCPFNCGFCCRFSGKTSRLRNESIKAELEQLIARFDIDDVWFLDEEFALNEKRAAQICEILGSLSRPLSFACSMRVDGVTPGMLRNMKEAGCRTIVYGVESGSPKILHAMNKGFTPAQASRAITMTREQGIEACVNIMYGYPGETQETFRETIDFMKKHRLHSGFGFATPLPGTPLFDWAVNAGLINDLDDYLENVAGHLINRVPLNLTSMSDEQLVEMRNWGIEETRDGRIMLRD